MDRKAIVCMTALAALLSAEQGWGRTIAFDPFPIGADAYTNNVDLILQGPTNAPVAGFTNAWAGGTTLAESSTTTIDAPGVMKSGGTCRFTGYNDTSIRTVYRYFKEWPCNHGDTNYWSVIISLDGRDSDDKAYVTWRDSAAGSTYMAIDLGIYNGSLFARLRESLTLDLGAYTPGKAYQLVARAVISRGDSSDAAFENTTVWINPSRGDIINGTNIAANYTKISFISPNYDLDKVEITTQNIGGSTAYFDELLYTTDIDDLNLSAQKIQSATFNPMPRPDADGSYAHQITHDFSLDSITLDDGRYPHIEGPTNAWVAGSPSGYYPVNGSAVSAAEALVGLNVNVAGNISTAEVTFATTVTNGFQGGFFLLDFSGDDYEVVVRPLDAGRNPIGNWSLTISTNTPWGENLTGAGKLGLNVRFTDSAVGGIGGLAFTLGDFTGGSGVLTDVKGLQIVDASPSCDLVMAGIYQKPTEALAYGSTAAPMTAAAFSRALTDNPITNDFQITGISTSVRDWKTVEGAATAHIHVYSDAILVYPQNGVTPASKEASLEGLSLNGLLNSGYYIEFMFATPVTSPRDRMFLIDDITFDYNAVTVRPLDANRFPISTHSLEIGAGDWGGTLTPNTITYNNWGGTQSGRKIGGVTFGLSDFAGGTDAIDCIWGIRVENADGLADLMMAGRTKADGILIMVH